MPKRRKRRLRWAFTVLRDMPRRRAISAFSQPCNNSETTCCSLGPNSNVADMNCSYLSAEPYLPKKQISTDECVLSYNFDGVA